VIATRAAHRVALAAILLAALGWRLYNIGFGLPGMYDPDEPIFMITALKLLGEGTLNPGWFGHPGTTTIYLVALIDAAIAAAGFVTGRYDDIAAFSKAAYADPALLFIPARVAMALIGTACVGLTYILGSRIHGRAVGLIAAALLAFNALHITWSQVIRTDIHASFFLLLCLWACSRISETASLKHYFLAGLFAGFAIATKWPTATVAAAIVGAAHLSARTHGVPRILILRNLLVTAIATLGATFIASPYIFLDWQTVLANVSGEIRSGHLDHSSVSFFHNLGTYLLSATGGAMAVGVLALTAIGIMLATLWSETARWTTVPVTILFLALISSQEIIWTRWVLPVLPMLCIFAALTAKTWIKAAASRFGRRGQAAAIGMLALVAGVPTFYAALGAAIERRNDTRMQAVRWAIANIPSGSRVAYEHLELNVRRQPWTILFPVGEAGCIDGARAIDTGVKFEEVQRLRNGSPIVDLGNVSADKIASCRADFAVLTYYNLYLREPDRYSAQIRTYREILNGGRTVALFRPSSGKVGGPIVRIVALTSQ
jgi:hypothetical protein